MVPNQLSPKSKKKQKKGKSQDTITKRKTRSDNLNSVAGLTDLPDLDTFVDEVEPTNKKLKRSNPFSKKKTPPKEKPKTKKTSTSVKETKST